MVTSFTTPDKMTNDLFILKYIQQHTKKNNTKPKNWPKPKSTKIHPKYSYALKPVLPPHIPIRPIIDPTLEKIDTATL